MACEVKSVRKVVYLVNDKAKMVQEELLERGFEVLVGNGEFYNEEYLKRCWALMPGRGYVTKETLDKAPNLKFICKQGVGLDRIDVEACSERGITVANTPDSNAISVAEHTMALMLACTKQLYPLSLHIRGAALDNSCTDRFKASELHAKTLAIIGFGSIGSKVAKMARAFDMHIIAYVRQIAKYRDKSDIEFTDCLEKALSGADVISLHVSGTKENRHLIGKRELALMKRSAIVINTTRGFVIDEDALYEALVNHRIAGAGLDVFEREPLTAGNRLLKLENVVATPHSAANTPESNRRAHLQCVRIIQAFAETENALGASAEAFS